MRQRVPIRFVVGLALMVTAGVPDRAAGATPNEDGEPDALPWKRRGSRHTLNLGRGVADLSRWPLEPEAPATESIDRARLAKGLETLCGRKLKPERAFEYAGHLLTHGDAFDVDPFTVAAVVYVRSHCQPREKKERAFGLAMIEPLMHRGHLSGGIYSYQVRRPDGSFEGRSLRMDAFKFDPWQLMKPEPAIYFTSALLRVAREQLETLQAAQATLGGVPYRHHVSNLAWGDRVKDTDLEERILIARRRLLGYYGALPDAPNSSAGAARGVPIRSPLDGGTRKLISIWGDDRDDGKRKHRGIDYWSTSGEPVRAAAAGVVHTAGADRQGKLPRNVHPKNAWKIPWGSLGNGGLIVKIDHGNDVMTAYMHLSKYVVAKGDKVEAGQLIGYVGRSGCKGSAAHLHFELRLGNRKVNPQQALGRSAIVPAATRSGQRGATMQAKRREERAEQRKKARAKR